MEEEDYCTCCGPECSMCFATETDSFEEDDPDVESVEENI